MFLLDFLGNIIRLLKDSTSPPQLAAGLALGFMIGFTPNWPLHVILLTMMVLMIHINLGMVLIGATIATSLSWLSEHWLDQLGHYILTDIPALQNLWSHGYDNPVLILTQFNNTVVMGALSSGTILSLVIFLISYWVFTQFSSSVKIIISEWSISHFIKQSKLYHHLKKTNTIETTL